MNALLMLYFKDGAEDVIALEKRAENFLSNDMNCQKIEGFVVAGAYSYSKVYKCNLR
jgi:protein involved in ribonucleotide reduction